MSHQEEGWPLGLQPLNVRVGLVRNRERVGSLSFNTLFSGSPTSSADSSSDLDTESTGSFFHDKSITLGSLIGISSILELPRTSTRGRTTDPVTDKKLICKSRPWYFSLCGAKLSTDAVNVNNTTPSLGHFLETERRAAHIYRRNHSRPSNFRLDDFDRVLPPVSEPNVLFIGNNFAPPRSCSDEGSCNGDLIENRNGHGAPLPSCLCGQLTH